MKRSAIKRKTFLGKAVFRKRGAGGRNPIPGVRLYSDGREVCITSSMRGRTEYWSRIAQMIIRQHGRCCLEGYAPMCPGALRYTDATFEHQRGRGMGGGKRDDRIALPDGTWINGAAHWLCNNWKGSRFIPYNADRNKENGHDTANS